MPWENNRPSHVPPRVRQACLERDGGRCTAILNTGHRCAATTELEAAHLGQWKPGEKTTVNMVRTLCHWHHNRETQEQASRSRPRMGSARRKAEKHPGLR